MFNIFNGFWFGVQNLQFCNNVRDRVYCLSKLSPLGVDGAYFETDDEDIHNYRHNPDIFKAFYEGIIDEEEEEQSGSGNGEVDNTEMQEKGLK